MFRADRGVLALHRLVLLYPTLFASASSLLLVGDGPRRPRSFMTVTQLNKLLARELGYVRLTDEGVYKWEWSDDLYWPAYRTGRKIEKTSPGGIFYFEAEYKRDRMTNKRAVWIVTKWMPPETFTDWDRNFPGAAYPADGYRVHTAYLASRGLPSLAETEDLIAQVKESGEMSFSARLADMQDDLDKQEKRKEGPVKDQIRDSFTAFLNEAPGKRGNSVSMPYTKFDRVN